MVEFKYLMLFVVLVSNVYLTQGAWETPLTNINFKELFVQRCLKFGKLERTPELYKPKSFDKASCEVIWKKFKASVGYKDPCSLTVSDYTPFIEHSNSLLQNEDKVYRDKTTFWSGTKPYADGASRRRKSKYLTLGSLFHGNIVDDPDISWCGDPQDPSGFKTVMLVNGKKDRRVCTNAAGKICYPISKYWETVSINLATKARGKVYVIFNADNKNPSTGADKPAFVKESVFGTSELPTIEKQRLKKKEGNIEVEKSRVTELIVLTILPFDSKTPRAFCNEKDMRNVQNADRSLTTLEKDEIMKPGSIFKENMAKYTCKDHPETEFFLKEVCRDNKLQIVRDNQARCQQLLAK